MMARTRGVAAALAVVRGAVNSRRAAGSSAVAGAGGTAGPGRVPTAVAWGLLGAWAVHDAEELVTMARWTRAARPRLAERFPGVPWERLEVSQAHVNVAIGLMGGVVAVAAAAGARTGGRSPVFQAALAGFGAHGVVHLAQAALVRGYTPGVVTAPVVVIPYAVWAWRRLRRAGVPVHTGRSGPVALPLVLAGVHALAHALVRRRPTTSPHALVRRRGQRS
ncbi:HXXEE domain-containing protein [Nonomuraea sp. MTCD27]|uniref:HXXEE domain-containing protein n=1 Tax=Nonomuraea sp. MTCD27 TaxID=1676747 RepID=UPI0035C0F18D